MVHVRDNVSLGEFAELFDGVTGRYGLRTREARALSPNGL